MAKRFIESTSEPISCNGRTGAGYEKTSY